MNNVLFNFNKFYKRMQDNIKIYLKDLGCEDVDWIHMAEDKI